MIEQFDPPFQRHGGRVPYMRGIAFLFWIDETTLRSLNMGRSRQAAGWLLAVHDRGETQPHEQHSFSLGPVQFERIGRFKLWNPMLTTGLAGLGGSMLRAYAAEDVVEALERLGEEHTAGKLRADWSVWDVGYHGELAEPPMLEAMLPRLAQYTAEFWASLSPRARRAIDRERLAPTGPGGRWRHA